MTLSHGSQNLGTLHLELYDQTVPKTVRNFTELLQRQSRGYRGSIFHRIIAGFMAQGGDFTKGDGTGGESIYGPTFADENFVHGHNQAGMLSMANHSGPGTNASQFFITFRPTPHLNGKHVVFGKVDLTKSADVLVALEQVQTSRGDRPRQPVTIVECGVEGAAADEQVDGQVEARDEDEIDLDEPEEEPVVEEEEEEEEAEPTNKSDALKQRLRKLKQKMNQARRLNQQAVREEGQRMSQQDVEKKRQHAMDKKKKAAAFEARHARALETAKEYGVDGKAVVQQASESQEKARIRAEKFEASQFSPRDYHNPEGQARNYERNLKSLPRQAGDTTGTTETYNPLMAQADPEQERDGARRLAKEMHRRIEKQKKSQLKKRAAEDDSEVSHINKRNRLFNAKISRNYDKHTAEIRQNLERGTAL